MGSGADGNGDIGYFAAGEFGRSCQPTKDANCTTAVILVTQLDFALIPVVNTYYFKGVSGVHVYRLIDRSSLPYLFLNRSCVYSAYLSWMLVFLQKPGCLCKLSIGYHQRNG